MNYFGLWIDQEFDRGHSKAVPRSSTFNSPQLSKFDEFDVCVLEVWHVGPQPKRKESSHDELLEEVSMFGLCTGSTISNVSWDR